MSYGGHPYGGVGYGVADVADIPQNQTDPALAVEVAFTTGALETPVWVDVTADVRSWDVGRGRNRELERFQRGRATVVLGNRSRQYDSVYEAGPWFGNIRPMRRIRIRETFNGVTYPVFDGFTDRWQLDYPDVGLDATATVTATDAMKVLARTELERSVWTIEVKADDPEYWWRLDDGLAIGDETSTALNAGSVGTSANGTYLNTVTVEEPGLVVGDPGTSIRVDAEISASNSGLDVGTGLNLLSRTENGQAFTVELWARPDKLNDTLKVMEQQASSPAISRIELEWENSGSSTGHFILSVDASTVSSANNSAPVGQRHHVAIVATPTGSDMKFDLWLNGSLAGSFTHTATVNTGTLGPLRFGSPSVADISVTGDQYAGWFDEIAIYLAALTSTRIGVHNTAGRTPWEGDLPGARLDRLLDIAEWPATQRELDDGATTLQSAELGSQPVLEHAQKVAETEFGLLFVNRAGDVRFISRANVWARTPGPEVYGDGAGQVGYTEFVPDDGDEVIRNRAVISRLGGVAQTISDDGSIDEFGRFDYVLDGLLHQSDSYSRDYATTIVAEYAQPRRRISSLSLGPPITGEEDAVFPAMLGRELGDYITVTNTPLGGGDPFEQICAVEGIRISGTPKVLTATWTLSPMLGGELPMDWADYTPTLANITQGNGTLVARFARSGNTVLWYFRFTLGSTSAIGSAPTFTLPVTGDSTITGGSAIANDAGTGFFQLSLRETSAGTTLGFYRTSGVTATVDTAVSATVPHTWATGDTIEAAGFYEAA